MKNKLFIRLPDDERSSLHWGVWSSDNQSWIEQGQLLAVDLVALAEQSKKYETIVISPSTLTSIREVTTPAKQLKQIQRAVPYTLEDQLASPVEQLHFAYGKRDRTGLIKVAWTTRSQMERWKEWFEQAEVNVTAIVNELDLLSQSTDATEIYLDHDRALVSETSGKKWSCQRDLLPLLFEEKTDKGNDEEASHEPVRVFHTGELESHWLEQEHVISSPMSDEELFSLLCSQFNKDSVNLLQGEYAVKKQTSLPLKRFRSAIAMSIFALTVFLVFQGSRFVILQKEESILREQANTLFQRVFSRKPRGSNILGQVKRLAKRSVKPDAQGEFLKLLNATTAQIASTQVIKPTSITFDNRRSELRVDVLAPDYQSLNQFKDVLSKNGLNVEMSSASAQGDLYSSRLVIRSGS